ncbi:maltase-glucoamylase, intestinal-like [Orbicella faveolata]|uniref:maltase-glucoamylase, intestinal-like n=1 Tax=Orbicella faveolata TaxID=48498 RepID=UPI0009E5EF28|nr:maltase-glucoamylase, intestinal-like [Orbicella faveolata]
MASFQKQATLLIFLGVFFLTSAIAERVLDQDKIDCYPEVGNQTLCEARGCTWEQSGTKGVPWCFFPKSYRGGYKIEGDVRETQLGYQATLKRRSASTIYGQDIDEVTLDVEFQTNNRVRFKLYDSKTQRYEVPVPMPKAMSKASDPTYTVEFKNDPFSLKILRKDTDAVLWDSSVGPFIFEDQFIQISTQPPSSFVYGFGEQEHQTFKHNLSTWEVLAIFTRDQFPFNGGNLYGHHPFYTCMENDGKSHGVFLMNSNAMDVALQPMPAITYRTIGGILDFYIFLGPSPEDVVKQYTEAIGRTFLPPYWSLGFQLSRWGYNKIETVKGLVENMRKNDLPQDVQFGDIDYMIRQKDFTYDPVNFKGLPEFVRSIKKDGLRYIIILDPAIGANDTGYRPYDWGNELNVFIKDGDSRKNENLFGKVWPTFENVTVNSSLDWDEQTRLYRQYATFPDYFHPNISKYWGQLIRDFHNIIEFDGLWIDMNEPANFVPGSVSGCSKNTWDYPPYKPRIVGNILADKTVCMNAKQTNSLHYNVHSLYGWSQTLVTLDAARQSTGKRSLVISRSTFASSGKYAGHWLGDNKASWDQLHPSIVGMLEFNLFGIPYIGADVCGFFDHPTPEMCLRWTQLGAFYPFFRNHNGFGNKAQDPAAFGEEFANKARKVLQTRYRLLPFLYTLFYEAQMDGSTVVRPVMHEFADDKDTWEIDRQFLWGPSLLISPVLEESKTTVDAYFPDDRWYDYYTGKEMSTRKGHVPLDAPLDHIPLHVRGGYIIPTQEPANNTAFSRKKPMGLIVALGDEGEASGQLFWDDGESIDTVKNSKYLLIKFSADESGLTFSTEKNGYSASDLPKWGSVTVYGLDKDDIKTPLSVDGQDMQDKATYDGDTKVLNITGLSLSINEEHQIKWGVIPPKGTGHQVYPFATDACLLLLAIIVAFIEH